jgi:translation initiation factor 5
MSLNVNKEVEDDFYRYKIPRIETRLVGKGNGRRTVLLNIEKIAKGLNRPVTYLLKFFSYELGTQYRLDKHNHNYVINGVHAPEIIHKMIFNFIEKYILCSECRNPETIYKIKVNKRIIKCLCLACGHMFEINDNDKLSNFIINNHIKDMKK